MLGRRTSQPICSASSTMIPSGPRARRPPTTASMSWTAKATWRMPGVFDGGGYHDVPHYRGRRLRETRRGNQEALDEDSVHLRDLSIPTSPRHAGNGPALFARPIAG